MDCVVVDVFGNDDLSTVAVFFLEDLNQLLRLSVESL
jgi:hypothetical protein